MSPTQVTSETADRRWRFRGMAPIQWSDVDRGHGGYLLVMAPLMFGVLGFWIDGMLGWTPILTIVGVVYGLVGALVKLLMTYRAEMAEHAETRRSAGRTDPVRSAA